MHHTDYAVGFFFFTSSTTQRAVHSYSDAGLLLEEKRPRGNNVCVLTTWKNLGTGVSVSDGKWESHFVRAGIRRAKTANFSSSLDCSAEECAIATAYEGEENMVKQDYGWLGYRSCPDKEMLGHLAV